MNARTCLSIVLAAGEGTRMRSSLPKVLHRIGNRPLIAHVLVAVREVGGSVAVVLAREHGGTADLVRRRGFVVETVPLAEFARAEGGVTCLSLLFKAP